MIQRAAFPLEGLWRAARTPDHVTPRKIAAVSGGQCDVAVFALLAARSRSLSRAVSRLSTLAWNRSSLVLFLFLILLATGLPPR